jgi:hypothetical protein
MFSSGVSEGGRFISHVLFGLDLAIFCSIVVAELRMSVGLSTLMCSEMAWNLEKPDVEKNKKIT